VGDRPRGHNLGIRLCTKSYGCPAGALADDSHIAWSLVPAEIRIKARSPSAGHLRVLMLTPSGPRFGQGPEAGMGNESAVNLFFSPATTLMQLLTSRATDSGTQAPR
jgi:hypothetical protein